LDRAFGRRRFLRAGAGTALALAGPWARAVGQSPSPDESDGPSPSPSVPPGHLRLLTSPDHWDPGVLVSLAADLGIDVRVSPLTDDATAFDDVRRGGAQADLVSADGQWITAYHAAGLTDVIDLADIAVVTELYPIARTMDLVSTPDGLLAYPWSWSPLQIVYDPARVGHAIGSWDVLVDPRSRGRIVIEAQQMDLVLCAARATGARDPLDMTDGELAKVTDWLTRLKPNVRRIVRHRGDAIAALASGECTLAISGLGAPDMVKDAGGPEVVAYVPSEGTIGSIEAEMVVAGAPNAVRVPAYLDAAAAAEAAAAAFLADGRPLFNERAYRLLVDSGHGARADRYLYDRPEVALEMTLTGPGARPEAYLAAAQVIFGDQ
jgi:spermidine/putrescine-binding protein